MYLKLTEHCGSRNFQKCNIISHMVKLDQVQNFGNSVTRRTAKNKRNPNHILNYVHVLDEYSTHFKFWFAYPQLHYPGAGFEVGYISETLAHKAQNLEVKQHRMLCVGHITLISDLTSLLIICWHLQFVQKGEISSFYALKKLLI